MTEYGKKIGIIGSGGSFVGSHIGALMAMAGAALPVLSEPQRLHPPKEYPPHERHQGAKERARRLKRIGLLR